MKLFSKQRADNGHIPPHIEQRIREGILNWIENRAYRQSQDCMDNLADKMNVATEQLSDFMRDKMGVKYRSLRRILRIRDAQLLLLLHPKQSCAQIGCFCGITDPSDFRKQFRISTGFTPKRWRERILTKSARFRG